MPDRAAGLRIHEVKKPTDPAVGPAHRLLQRLFPRAELLPLADWRYALRERAAGLWTDLNWHLLVAREGERLVGVATANYIGNVNVGMIGYVAVTRSGRARGTGVELRERLGEVLQQDAIRLTGRRLAAIVGEVHADNPWLRRLVRYGGALPLDFPYAQPSIRKMERTVPLVLYYQALGRRRDSLPVAEVRRLVYTIWRRVYRIDRPLSWRAFRTMTRSLERRRAIGARALPPPRSHGGVRE